MQMQDFHFFIWLFTPFMLIRGTLLLSEGKKVKLKVYHPSHVHPPFLFSFDQIIHTIPFWELLRMSLIILYNFQIFFKWLIKPLCTPLHTFLPCRLTVDNISIHCRSLKIIENIKKNNKNGGAYQEGIRLDTWQNTSRYWRLRVNQVNEVDSRWCLSPHQIKTKQLKINLTQTQWVYNSQRKFGGFFLFCFVWFLFLLHCLHLHFCFCLSRLSPATTCPAMWPQRTSASGQTCCPTLATQATSPGTTPASSKRRVTAAGTGGWPWTRKSTWTPPTPEP